MSYRVQFVVSDKEHLKLLEMMSNEGYNSLSELCKERIFGKASYRQLYQSMLENIAAMPEGNKFHLSDVVDSPAPAVLGKQLFEKVADGTIPFVKHLGKDTATNTEMYLKKYYLNIFCWNINCRSGSGGSEIQVDFVKNAILKYNKPKIIVLTEFVLVDGYYELETFLNSLNYKCWMTNENKYGNGILIALDKNTFETESIVTFCLDYSKYNPDFLQINSSFKDGTKVSIVGVRIHTYNDYNTRKKQFETFLKRIKGIDNVIALGDFNNGKIRNKEEYKNEGRNYNYSIIKEMLESPEKENQRFKIFTPVGDIGSWGLVNKDNEIRFGAFKNDHLILSNKLTKIYNQCDRILYDWTFINENYEIFQNMPVKNQEYKTIDVKTGFPDHAILYAEFSIKDNCKK